jgi:cyclophilin family peptidyl-prolyl cis-trans isomerase
MGKSSVARRRRQINERKARQNRIIRVVSAVSLTILALLAVYLFVQAQNPKEESIAMSNNRASEPMGAEHPLASIPPAERDGYFDAYPEMTIDPQGDYEALIQTGKGNIRVQLFADKAPLAVNNFVFLANQGFFDGLTFHRVIEDFMAQGGDPTGRGSGGPGYRFEDETDNGLTFDRPGLLAMANAGPGTNGSQFFITFVATGWLNGNHTIFGEVIEGNEVLSQLTRRQPGAATPADTIERIDTFRGP